MRAVSVMPWPGSADVSHAKAPRGWRSRGRLPHFDGGEVPQALCFRLADAMPMGVLSSWQEEFRLLPGKEPDEERIRRIEAYLDAGAGKCWLRDERIAEVVQRALLHFDGDRYCLHAWIVMPNHVHVLFTPSSRWSLSCLLHSWKSYTAKEANRILGKQGVFWQDEYFDRYIRNERHFGAVFSYIEQNPVKAGLCGEARAWKFGSAARGMAGGTPAPPKGR